MSSHVTQGHLTRRESNRLYETAQQTPLGVSSLQWLPFEAHEFGTGDRATGCGVRVGDDYFGLRLRAGRYDLTCSPNPDIAKEDSLSRTSWRGPADNFDALLHRYSQWAAAVVAEPPPDLWDQASDGVDDDWVDNSRFTAEEQLQLDERLRLLEERIVTEADLTPEQQEHVGVRFRYLRAAKERLGRLDWLQALHGVFLDMLVKGLVSYDLWFKLLPSVTARLLFGSEFQPPPSPLGP